MKKLARLVWLMYCISFSSSSLDYDSEEFFDADTEMLDNGAAEVGDAREMVPIVSWDVPSDVEDDEDFNDPDDSAGGSTKMVLQLSTGSCSCLHTFSLPPPGSIRSHRSVIFHILAQLRVGMDITRISLPSFMLERRSFLEMIGESLAHADIFAR